MIRRMVIGGQPNWPKELPQLLANYNSNKHSVLRMAPNEARDDNLKEAKERIKKRAVAKNHNSLVLNEGDKVRLVNFKKQKDPSYKDEPNWWPEIYEIYHVIRPKDPSYPLRYNLEPNPPTTIVGNRPGYRWNCSPPYISPYVLTKLQAPRNLPSSNLRNQFLRI